MAKKPKKQEEKAEAPKGFYDTFEMGQDDLRSLASQIQRDMIEAEQDKETWNQERLKDIRAFFGIKKQADWPFKGAAKISSQLHRIMVETMAANILTSFVAPEKMIAVAPDNSSSIENAKYVSDLHNTIAKREYKLPEVLDKSLHNSLIESYVVLKPCYEFKTTEVVKTVRRWLPKEYDPKLSKYDMLTDTVTSEDGQVVPSTDIESAGISPEEAEKAGLKECIFDVTKEVVTKDGITVYSIGGSHIFIPIWSPGETPFEKYQRAPYVIHQEFPTIQEMEAMEYDGKIKNVELVKLGMVEQLSAETLRDQKYNQVGQLDAGTLERKVTENLWWYGKFMYKGKMRELCVYMNRPTGTVLKVKVNEFGIRPFFPIVPFPIDETPFGESLPKKIRELVSEIELAMNTILNMGMIKAYPPKFFDPNAGFDPKTIGNFGPNSYIPVRDPNRNIAFPQMPEDPRILMDMVRLLMDLVERTTANSDAVQGQVSPTANTTAFEVQQALVRAGVRFDIVFRRIKSQLSPMFNYIQMLLLRFMPPRKEVMYMGDAGLKDGNSKLYSIAKADIEGQYSFELAGNSSVQEVGELQKAQQLFTMFAQDPYISFKPESAYYLRYNLIKHFNPVAIDKILPTPEEVQQLLRDRQQVQNEQEALALAAQEGALPNVGTPQGAPPAQGPATPQSGA